MFPDHLAILLAGAVILSAPGTSAEPLSGPCMAAWHRSLGDTLIMISMTDSPNQSVRAARAGREKLLEPAEAVSLVVLL
jgi:hypothetical protein